MEVTFTNDICDFKRGGWCKTCERFGYKVLEVSKTWEKMKNGLFGHKLRKKVTWKCRRQPAEVKTTSSNSDVRDNTTTLEFSKLQGADELQLGNFTTLEGCKAGCASETEANSCEPRT